MGRGRGSWGLWGSVGVVGSMWAVRGGRRAGLAAAGAGGVCRSRSCSGGGDWRRLPAPFLTPFHPLPPQPTNFTNPVYATLYMGAHNSRNSLASTDEKRELLSRGADDDLADPLA